MAGNAAERSEWRHAHASTGWVGQEGREGTQGSEGMGVNERASEEGGSLQAGSVRNATEGSEWRGQARHMHAASYPRSHAHYFSPPSMKSLLFYMVSDEVEKICMGS
jgi:hypothetical protein